MLNSTDNLYFIILIYLRRIAISKDNGSEVRLPYPARELVVLVKINAKSAKKYFGGSIVFNIVATFSKLTILLKTQRQILPYK